MKKPTQITPNPRLKQARLSRGWSQEDVAREVGTDAFTVGRWERGVTIPSTHFRPKLCALFNMSATELGLVPQEMEEKEELSSQTPKPLLDPAIPPPPAGETGLIGRDGVLRQINQQLLTKKQVALSALNGLPGVGKTALATALAHDEEIQAHFSDGILWAGLGPQPDILGLLSRWGSMLGCAPVDLAQRSKPEAWAASIHAAIGQRHILLIIDDVWDFADALALQIGGNNSAHLITTRIPAIARRFSSEGTIIIRELGSNESRLLLTRLAPDAVQSEPQETLALIGAVGGLPLALTLLGNFLRTQAHSGQPRRIHAALERLRRADERLHLTEPQALIGSHPSLEVGTPLSLQVAIGISVQQISSDARTTLGALAVFSPKPNTFSEEAAMEVSAMPVETLDELSDAGLLESSGPERYTLHQTIADYAVTLLSETTARERLATYYVRHTKKHWLDYAELDRENHNILTALEAAYTLSMQQSLVQGTHAFAPFLITRGLYAVAETLLQRSLAAARTLAIPSEQVRAQFHLGKIAELRSNYIEAHATWQNALPLAREHADISGSAKILRELGNLAHSQGEPEQARQFLSQALEAQIQIGDQLGAAETQCTLGDLIADQGQPENAHTLYTAALTIFRQMGDQRGTALVLGKLGVLAREQSQPELARQLYDKALTIFRQIGDQNNLGRLLINLGNLTREQGRPELARQFYEEALEINQRTENRRALAFTILNLGSLASDQGQFEQARQLFYEVIPIFRQLQNQRNLAMTLQGLGCQEIAEGQLDLAREHLDEALTLFRKIHDQRQTSLTAREFGALARMQGQLKEAHLLLAEALTILEQLGDQREAAVARQEMGTLARLEGHPEKAHILLTLALTEMRQMQDRRNAPRALRELGELAWQEDHMEQALHYLLSALVGMKLMQWYEGPEVETQLRRLHMRLGTQLFLTLVHQLTHTTPEPAYGISPEIWSATIQQIMDGIINGPS
ncbi:tetratricopeptide repeat protein [Ktedonospora formicarum]|uniref:HTH cro/C1-type domain-containing protein n=1 Tax=Ktedonospora formicarum TaxID=2778364 RepID=A0A8J3MPM7_9CHLR|nr:tetratricopeptide repeat protein [Ktedonospora formicarum]GHO41921.1 hypothetical protein KSX_00840 [Ktedonospora formicarum]